MMETDMNATISLYDGIIVIPAPQDRLGAYYSDFPYSLYDQASVLQDCSVTISDIYSVATMYPGIVWNAAPNLYAIVPELNELLGAIGPCLSLTAEAEPSWAALSALLQRCCEVPEVAVSTATKVLHKKRPGLIPIIDSVVEGKYKEASAAADVAWPVGEGTQAVLVMQMMREDLLSGILPQIDALRLWVWTTRGIALTRVRVLEVLIWIMYEPKATFL